MYRRLAPVCPVLITTQSRGKRGMILLTNDSRFRNRLQDFKINKYKLSCFYPVYINGCNYIFVNATQLSVIFTQLTHTEFRITEIWEVRAGVIP